MNNYLIYKRTNTISGKSYIGYTSTSESKRWKQHINQALYNKAKYKIELAILKYGGDTWVVEIIEDNLTLEDAKLKEIYYIGIYDTYKNGYNSTIGGDNSNVAVSVVAINSKTKEFEIYESISEASNKLNITQPSISYVINGKRKQAGGYVFIRINEFDETKIESITTKPVRVAKIKTRLTTKTSLTIENAETNELLYEFSSVDNAAKTLGYSSQQIRNWIDGKFYKVPKLNGVPIKVKLSKTKITL